MKKTFSLLVAIVFAMQLLSFGTVFAESTLNGEGTADSPYQIATVDDLAAFRELVNGGSTTSCAIVTADIVIEDNWTPIGTSSFKYNGTFDGN